MLPSQCKEHYLRALTRYRARGADDKPPWLQTLRQSAISSFAALGFPTSRNEEWKFTSVDPILSVAFEPPNGAAFTLNAADILDRACAAPSACRLVFVNGTFVPELSLLGDLPAGVRAESLSRALKEDDEIVAPYLGRSGRYQKDVFVALNTAFMEDGAVLSIAPGLRLEEPIHMIFVSMAGAKPVVSCPRILLRLGAGSEVKTVESHIGLGQGSYFTNAVTEVIAEEDAIADHYRVQRETDSGFHISALEATVNRNASITAHAITLGGGLVRNDVRVVLNGEGSACVLNGLYLLDGKQHVDNHTEIEHARPRATSLELYKGILGGSARAVFNGKIVVEKAAQKSNARQTNKNLLLSENAAVNTMPQLEIYADDVKCSHGSTIGQLEADALFYLRSRGIGIEDAQSLLSYAFASEVVSRVKIAAMRARLDDYLLTKFGRK